MGKRESVCKYCLSKDRSRIRMYRDRLNGVQILLSNSQEGPGRTVKQEQEEIYRNHVQTFIYLSVHFTTAKTNSRNNFCLDIAMLEISAHAITLWLA